VLQIELAAFIMSVSMDFISVKVLIWRTG